MSLPGSISSMIREERRIAHFKLQEMPYGWPVDDPDEICIYTDGHIDREAFLVAVRQHRNTSVPSDALEALDLDDVRHIVWRRMSPSEARANGLNWGVYEDDGGTWKVTGVIL